MQPRIARHDRAPRRGEERGEAPQGVDGGAQIDHLAAVVARLHAPPPEGCPWCLEQTHLTLRDYLIEEAYEVADAIDGGNVDALADELGDVLLLVLTHVQLAAQAGEFQLSDVLQGAIDKTVRRNPHVFGDVQASTAEEVLRNWEASKRDERGDDSSLLAGIPRALPALQRADTMQARAAHVGFDWPDVRGVVEKLHEEVDELAGAPDQNAQTEELGDLLFSLVNLARRVGFSAEQALQQASDKFACRFQLMEAACQRLGVRPEELGLAQLDALWEQAKGQE